MTLVRFRQYGLLALFTIVSLSWKAPAQTTQNQSPDTSDPTRSTAPAVYPASAAPGPALRNLLRDQEDIWTSPFKARVQDLNWILPMAGVAAGALNADKELSSRISTTGTLARQSNTASNAGLGLALGGPGLLWVAGKWQNNQHEQETGILSLEAATNSLIVTEGLKLVTQRERPADGTGQGRFWKSSSPFDSSFPSAHAMLAWSAASVIGKEYPGVTSKIFAYGLATGVSVARVTGRDHFPRDVIVGSALGWLIGQQVYSRHHDAELPGEGYGMFLRDRSSEDQGQPSNNAFSPYVPIDSWVYPAFDRLAALGVIPTAMEGMKPWTRHECARLLEEASDLVDRAEPDEASSLYAVLTKEFASELSGKTVRYVGIDSIYSRV